jgi:hypothetical protein
MLMRLCRKCTTQNRPGKAREASHTDCSASRDVVGAPAFMRGKERFSAPAKSRDFDHALERRQCQGRKESA